MGANRFEDLIFWQKARELTKSVYSFTNKGDFKKDFGLRDQIQRSCVSVMSNIAEGFCRGGNKEFIQFLFVARGSLAEVQSQLYISRDLDYISDIEFKKAYSLTEEIFRLIGSFIQKTKITGKQGLKSI
ncbi:MAG: four helix bundle protein [bacterium]